MDLGESLEDMLLRVLGDSYSGVRNLEAHLCLRTFDPLQFDIDFNSSRGRCMCDSVADKIP